MILLRTVVKGNVRSCGHGDSSDDGKSGCDRQVERARSPGQACEAEFCVEGDRIVVDRVGKNRVCADRGLGDRSDGIKQQRLAKAEPAEVLVPAEPANENSGHGRIARQLPGEVFWHLGGMTGAFLETAAIIGVTRELSAAERPKPIGLTINYLRPGRAVDSYANVSIVKQGRRIVAFEARAWQDDANKPIASAFGHFMLRAMRGTDWPEVPLRANPSEQQRS